MFDRRRHKTISWILCLTVSAILCACAEDDTDTQGTEDVIGGSAAALEVSGEVTEGDAEAQQVSSLVGASIERVFLDAEAQRLLEVTDSLKRDPQDCYSREEIEDDKYRYDFDDCDNTEGLLYIEKLESGLVVATFDSTFMINQVGIVGSLTFDGQGRLVYEIYNSTPQGGHGAALVVTDNIEDTTSDVTVDGKAAIAILDSELSVWGTGTSNDGTTVTSFSLGYTTSSGPATDAPATALTWDLPRRNCDCPNDGVIWYQQSKLLVDGVTVDLDDFERNPDGEDDYPEFNVPIDLEVSGALTLDVTGCGTFEADFNAGIDVSIDLERGDLVAGKNLACGGDNQVLSDEACNAIGRLLDRQLDIDINVSIPDTRLDDLARARLDERFDRSICGAE